MERMTKEEFISGSGFFSGGGREEFENETTCHESDPVINFAYTDYGGDVFDIVGIKFFSEKYPDNIIKEYTGWNGENAVVFNTPDNPMLVQSFFEAIDDYLLGFEDIEETFWEVEDKFFEEFVTFVLTDMLSDYEFDKDKVDEWLHEEKMGYYNVTTQGIDFCSSSLEKEMLEANLITPKKD